MHLVFFMTPTRAVRLMLLLGVSVFVLDVACKTMGIHPIDRERGYMENSITHNNTQVGTMCSNDQSHQVAKSRVSKSLLKRHEKEIEIISDASRTPKAGHYHSE